MPGSGIPEKLRDWPLTEDGTPDVKGMAEFCAANISEAGEDYAKFRERVDQSALHDIMNRLTDPDGGIRSLQDDDVQHLLNSLALALASDTLHEASGCLQMLRDYVRGVNKQRGEMN